MRDNKRGRMKREEMLKRLMMATMLAQICASVVWAAEPTVSNVTAKQRYPWNGLVDITCKVTGINGVTNGLYFVMSAVDSGKTDRLSHFGIVQSGVNSDREVHTNGNYKLLWDAQKDLAEAVYSNMVVQVDLKTREKVQLWEGGPYWATTNVGANEPWGCGYYFWWGDIVGCRRENDAWVASDGSLSDFSFGGLDTPTYNKSILELQSEGWIVMKDGGYILAPAHDAAQMQWGGMWRVPTGQELSDLSEKCDWIGTTLNGMNGYIVRGRGDYAANSIFLPAPGVGSGTSIVVDASWYWSSTPHQDVLHPDAKDGTGLFLLIFSNSSRWMSNDYRYGLSIRPVQSFIE